MGVVDNQYLKQLSSMNFLIIILIIFAIWMSLVIYAKQEAKSLLSKYDAPLPLVKSNSIVSMIRKLRKLLEQRTIGKEDVGECKFIMAILKWTFVVFPTVMILVIVLPTLINK